MIKKSFIIAFFIITFGLATAYAQSSALDIAQNQARSSNTYANEQITSLNANRYAALQNQVGTTTATHSRIVDESKRNLEEVLLKIDLATTNYTSFNARFLH